jgi:RNA polymerase sigma factor (sigma-70 family)
LTVEKDDWLAERFEVHRPQLRTVAHRILGSVSEAEDAVQESWLRLDRSRVDDIGNLGAWLTTVVSRVSLNMLRARKRQRTAALDLLDGEQDTNPGRDPEQDASMANSVGLALLVVLGRLSPAERVAFVLHDMFDLPFEEIGAILGRSAPAARQLASRARRRVRGAPTPPRLAIANERRVIGAFLAASSEANFEALIAILDPEVVLRADRGGRSDAPLKLRGARVAAKQALAYPAHAQFARLALVNGRVGIVVAPRGRLMVALQFKIERDAIVEIRRNAGLGPPQGSRHCVP